jgi:glutamyl-Q tRNA(Asp) synthetase
VRTRFAPSPTGFLHLGHAFAALSVWQAAAEAHGDALLRIEDIDAGRCRPDFEAAIYTDLAWLGLTWPEPVLRQSERLAAYQATLDHLIGLGVLYRCFKTRKALALAAASAPHAPDTPYTGAPDPDESARLARDESFAWRLSIARARALLGPRPIVVSIDGQATSLALDRIGDVILARKDAPTSYYLACAHDDAAQGMTHVIRGEDLRGAAHIQTLLQALMGWPHPEYRHHHLLTGADGTRLSKRDGAMSLAALRAAGESPGSIRQRLGFQS